MRRGQFAISLILTVACLAAVIYIIYISRQNREIELALQQQQQDINRGTVSQQIGRSLVRDMASISNRNSKIKELLMLNGFTLSENGAANGVEK